MIESLYEKFRHWSAKGSVYVCSDSHFEDEGYIKNPKKRKEIAETLCISENTVKTHTSNVFSKLEVSTRNELIEKVKSDKN